MKILAPVMAALAEDVEGREVHRQRHGATQTPGPSLARATIPCVAALIEEPRCVGMPFSFC
jgi:hypothetical protein